MGQQAAYATVTIKKPSARLTNLVAPIPTGVSSSAGSLVTGTSKNTQDIDITFSSSAYLSAPNNLYFNVEDGEITSVSTNTSNASATVMNSTGNNTYKGVVVTFTPSVVTTNIVLTLQTSGGIPTEVTLKLPPASATGQPGLEYYTTNSSYNTASQSGTFNYSGKTQTFLLNNLYLTQPLNQMVTLSFKPVVFASTGIKSADITAGSVISITSTSGTAYSSTTGSTVYYNAATGLVDISYNPYVQGSTAISFRMIYNNLTTTITLSTTGASAASGTAFNIALDMPSQIYVNEANLIKATLTPQNSATANTSVQVTFTTTAATTQATLTTSTIQSAYLQPLQAGTITIVATVPSGYSLLNGDATTSGYYIDPATGQTVYGTIPSTKKTFVVTAVARNATATPTATATPAATPVSGNTKLGVPLKTGISVYDASGKVIGTLSQSSITITGESGSRLAFSYNGTTAYVAKALINVTENAAAAPDGDSAEFGLNIKRWCSFRDGPSDTARRIAKLVPSDRLTIYSNTNGWSYGTYKGQYGYVETQYLKP